MGKKYTNSNGWTIERASRWIKRKVYVNPTPKHALWDYATDGYGRHPYSANFDPRTGVLIDYFEYGGKKYALGQFVRNWLGAWDPYYSENNEDDYVIPDGYEDGNYYNPIYIEFDESGEYLRVYKDILK